MSFSVLDKFESHFGPIFAFRFRVREVSVLEGKKIEKKLKGGLRDFRFQQDSGQDRIPLRQV